MITFGVCGEDDTYEPTRYSMAGMQIHDNQIKVVYKTFHSVAERTVYCHMIGFIPFKLQDYNEIQTELIKNSIHPVCTTEEYAKKTIDKKLEKWKEPS